MLKHNARALPESRIEFRIGVHQGELVVEDGHIFGDGGVIAEIISMLYSPIE